MENWVNATEEQLTVRLSCNATDVGRELVKEIDWRYNARGATELDSELIFYGGRYHGPYYNPLKHVLDKSDNTTLVINNISYTDTGDYMCVEDHGFGSRHLHHLTVLPRSQ